MDFYLAARTNGAIVLSLAVAGVLLFWFGAPDSAGIQVVATLVLTASLILFLLPGSLRRARERQTLRTPRRSSAGKRTPHVLIALVLWLYLLWMVSHLAYGAFSGVSLAISERGWTSTEATVVSSSIGEGHTKRGSYWYAVLTYTYTADDTSYVGNGHDMYFTSPPTVESLAAARPTGYHLTAYYDPKNPQQSTLHLRKSFVERFALSLWIFMFCLFASPFVVLGMRAMRGRRWSSN